MNGNMCYRKKRKDVRTPKAAFAVGKSSEKGENTPTKTQEKEIHTMKTLNFGIEIELTGITRSTVAKTIAAYFGTRTANHDGGFYDTYTAKDNKGRTWKAMSDSSIEAQKKDGSKASDLYKTEIVSPILTYSDIEDLQELVRQLRHKGAIANDSTGIHIHVGAERFTPQTLRT